MRGTFFRGSPIIRIMEFWVFYWGPPVLEIAISVVNTPEHGDVL